MKKILYVATVASHICQFHLPYLEMFQQKGVEVHVAARNNLSEKNGLQLKFTDRYFDLPFERSPKDSRNIRAYKQLKQLIAENGYDMIVCNTPMGGILTRLAAKKARRNGTKVVYIAHGFHFYKGASKKSWLVFYPIEKLFARLCDTVITINFEDYEFAKAHFNARVRHIHGIGVNERRYCPADREKTQQLRQRLGLTDGDFAILCTGELNKNKNQEQLLRAAAMLKDKIPGLRILLAGNGPNEQDLIRQTEALNLQDTVTMLGYRTDLETVLPAVDLVVSCSKREGLGLNIIEAMLCGKPIVATSNRGHRELVREGENGYLVPIGDADALADRILSIYSDPEAAGRFAEHSKAVAKPYTVEFVKKELIGMLCEDEAGVR